jgi:putative redox protein
VSRLRRVELVRVEESYELAAAAGTPIRFGDPAHGALSPMDAVLAALATCTAMDVHAIAIKKRQQIDRYTVRVTAEQRDEHPRVFGRIDVSHELEGRGLSVDAIRRSIELSATRYCPVNAILAAGPAEVHHRYLIRSTAPETWEADGEVVISGPGQPAAADATG